MNKRVKIAILGLLGLSTAACCSTKKSNKSQDRKDQEVDINQEDPHIMVMYGVPFPDGKMVQPVDEQGNPVDENITEPSTDGVPFPDGSIVKPISEEEAVDVRPMLMYGVPFPDGEVVRPISEQEAEEKINEIAEEKSEATE